MSPLTQEVENFQTQPHCPENVDSFCNGNEQERELEEALSLSDLPLDKIKIGNQEGNLTEEESNQNAGEFSDNDFDFGSLVGSIGTVDGEMCAADEVFSGGQMLPYRNSVSSISGLRTLSRSDSDRRGFESRSNSSRSSSIRSHYSATSSASGNSSSSGSVKTVPLVLSKSKIRNQFHSYPSPKPQVLGPVGPGTRSATCTTPPGRRSKMWEVLRLGLVRTPEIELHDLKQRHRIANNHGKTITTIPRNNSIGSSSSTKSGIKINDDRARNSFSIDGNKITDFMYEIQKRKNQLPENKSNGNGNSNDSGFFKSCKCSVGAIEPIQSTRSNSSVKNGEIGSGNNKIVRSSQNISEANEDKRLGQKKIQVVEEQKHHQKQSRNNNHIRQGKQNLSHHHHHHHHHHHRTFEWLKNLSHSSVLNS